MRRIFLVGALALSLCACTPVQLQAWSNHTGHPVSARSKAKLMALPNAPFTDDGLTYHPDGHVTSGPPAFSSAHSGRSCTGLKPLLAYYSPGWNVDRMARIAWRESNCQLGVHTWCCRGLLQIHKQHFARASRELGITVNWSTITDPVVNVRVAAWLYRQDGMGPWAT